MTVYIVKRNENIRIKHLKINTFNRIKYNFLVEYFLLSLHTTVIENFEEKRS